MDEWAIQVTEYKITTEEGLTGRWMSGVLLFSPLMYVACLFLFEKLLLATWGHHGRRHARRTTSPSPQTRARRGKRGGRIWRPCKDLLSSVSGSVRYGTLWRKRHGDASPRLERRSGKGHESTLIRLCPTGNAEKETNRAVAATGGGGPSARAASHPFLVSMLGKDR